MDNHQIVYKNGEERNLSVKVAMSTGDNEEEGGENNDENVAGNDNENEDENNDN